MTSIDLNWTHHIICLINLISSEILIEFFFVMIFLHLSGKLMLIIFFLLPFYFILFFFLCVLLTLLCYLTFSGLKKRNRKVISTEVVKRSLLYFLHKKNVDLRRSNSWNCGQSEAPIEKLKQELCWSNQQLHFGYSINLIGTFDQVDSIKLNPCWMHCLYLDTAFT